MSHSNTLDCFESLCSEILEHFKFIYEVLYYPVKKKGNKAAPMSTTTSRMSL